MNSSFPFINAFIWKAAEEDYLRTFFLRMQKIILQGFFSLINRVRVRLQKFLQIASVETI